MAFGKLLKTAPLPDPEAVDPTQVVSVDPFAPAIKPVGSASFIQPINQPAPEVWKPSMLSLIDRVLGGQTFTEARRSAEADHETDLLKPQMQEIAKATLAMRQHELDDVAKLSPLERIAWLNARAKLGESYADRAGYHNAPAGSTSYYGDPTQGGVAVFAPKADVHDSVAYTQTPSGVTVTGVLPTAPKPDWKERKKADGSTEWIDLNDPSAVIDGGVAASFGGPGAVPRSVRNNNPGNIQDGAFARSLPGYKGTDGRFAIFDTHDNGAAAQTALLRSYGAKGLDTVQEVISRWAPPTENDTPAYVKFVAAKLGVAPDQKLNMGDEATLRGLSGAIAQFEGGPASKSNSPPSTGAPPRVVKGSEAQADDVTEMTPQSVDMAATRYAMTGVMPTFGQGKDAVKLKVQVQNRASELIKQWNIQPEDWVTGVAQFKIAQGSLGKVSQTRNLVEASEKAVEKNMDYVLTLAPKAQPGGVPFLNKYAMALKANALGDPAVKAYDNALHTVADEYAKVLTTTTGAGGTALSDSARQEAYRRLSSAQSLPQLQASFEAIRTEMANRKLALADQEHALIGQLRHGLAPGATAPTEGAAASPAPRRTLKGASDAQNQWLSDNPPASGKPGSRTNPFMPFDERHMGNIKAGDFFVNPSDGRLLQRGRM